MFVVSYVSTLILTPISDTQKQRTGASDYRKHVILLCYWPEWYGEDNYDAFQDAWYRVCLEAVPGHVG